MKNTIISFTLFTVLLFGISICVAFTTEENDWQEKVSPAVLQQTMAGEKVAVIVFFSAQADLSAAEKLATKGEKAWYAYRELSKIAQQTQANVRQILKMTNAKFRPFYIINAIHTEVDASLLEQLAAQREVARIYPNSLIEQASVVQETSPTLRGGTPEWGITMIGADQVWEMGYRGQGVVIGGQDTGYEWEHSVLKKQYRGWQNGQADHNYNWHDAIREINNLHNDNDPNDPTNNPCGLNVGEPCDDQNHGTHTMGTMVGEDDENQIGVAPGARWVACRNMERGYGSPATYIECFEWFMAPTDLNNERPNPLLAPHVINNSWGCPTMEGCAPENYSLMEKVVEHLKLSGVVVVVSAGNNGTEGCNSIRNPAAIFEQSFTIGATAKNDTIARFSSRGVVTADGSNRLKPNVSAPGVSVRSAIRDGAFANFSGTSMAGPHVAGLVALVISANPALAGHVSLIEEIIESTAVPKTDEMDCGAVLGSSHPNAVYGFGRVNALAAVEKALQITVPSLEYTHRLYPVPFREIVNLELKNWSGRTTLRVFNALGQQVATDTWRIPGQGVNTFELNFSKLAAGLYFYELENGTNTQSGKFLKN